MGTTKKVTKSTPDTAESLNSEASLLQDQVDYVASESLDKRMLVDLDSDFSSYSRDKKQISITISAFIDVLDTRDPSAARDLAKRISAQGSDTEDNLFAILKYYPKFIIDALPEILAFEKLPGTVPSVNYILKEFNYLIEVLLYKIFVYKLDYMPPSNEHGDAQLKKELDHLEKKYGIEKAKKEYAQRASAGVGVLDTGMAVVAREELLHEPLQQLIERVKNRPDLVTACNKFLETEVTRPEYAKLSAELTEARLEKERKQEREKKARYRKRLRAGTATAEPK